MKKDTYLHMTAFLRERAPLASALGIANKAITYAIYVAYPCLLVWLVATASPKFAQALLVPACSFVLLTFVRRAVNRPRPYEVFDSAPVIPKNTHGKSFPSRHVFSIFVIGTTFLAVCPSPLPGTAVLVLGCMLAVLRVVTGVHFPSDVAAGAVAGIAAGCLCFL